MVDLVLFLIVVMLGVVLFFGVMEALWVWRIVKMFLCLNGLGRLRLFFRWSLEQERKKNVRLSFEKDK